MKISKKTVESLDRAHLEVLIKKVEELEGRVVALEARGSFIFVSSPPVSTESISLTSPPRFPPISSCTPCHPHEFDDSDESHTRTCRKCGGSYTFTTVPHFSPAVSVSDSVRRPMTFDE